MKKNILLSLILAAFNFSSINAQADTIVLKSGQTISGKVFEKGEDHIKVEVSGTPITYYLDEIQSITSDNTKQIEMPISRPVSKKPFISEPAPGSDGNAGYQTQVYKPEGWMVEDGNSRFFKDNPVPGITPLFILAKELNINTSSIVIIGAKPNPDGISARQYVDALNSNPQLLTQQHSKPLEIVTVGDKPMAKQTMEIPRQKTGLSIITQTYYYFDHKTVFLIQVTGFPEILAGQKKEINSILESVKF